MKRRQPVTSEVAAGGIPVELLAGPCIEVWADVTPPPWADDRWSPAPSAYRNYSDARWRFLATLGLSRGDLPAELRGRSTPWSFHFLAETAPEVLEHKLEAYGLPADWEPRRARPTDG